jgi:ATP-dependent Lon protease
MTGDDVSTVETQAPPPNEPAAPESAVPRSDEASAEREVTTENRKPLRIPDTIHIRITPDSLKEYVGPPVYHKDRMYSRPPPPGVSTGLGYLGNGSGAVMPIEATVSVALISSHRHSVNIVFRVCPVAVA